MVLPIPPIAQKPPTSRLGPDSHDERRGARERPVDARAVPDEVVTLSDAARQGVLGHARHPEERDGGFGSGEDAAAAAHALHRRIRADESRAAAAQAHASASRVWNLVWD